MRNRPLPDRCTRALHEAEVDASSFAATLHMQCLHSRRHWIHFHSLKNHCSKLIDEKMI